MSSSAVLTFIAVVLSVGDGSVTVGGEPVGLLAPGDRGQIYYELTVGPAIRRIEVGPARVISVADGTAVLEPAADVDQVRPGYVVELTVPFDRLAPASAQTADPLRERLDELQRTIDRIAAERDDLAGRLDAASRESDRLRRETRAAAEGELAVLRERLERLERRNTELETELEAVVFVLGKTVAEAAQ